MASFANGEQLIASVSRNIMCERCFAFKSTPGIIRTDILFLDPPLSPEAAQKQLISPSQKQPRIGPRSCPPFARKILKRNVVELPRATQKPPHSRPKPKTIPEDGQMRSPNNPRNATHKQPKSTPGAAQEQPKSSPWNMLGCLFRAWPG